MVLKVILFFSSPSFLLIVLLLTILGNCPFGGWANWKPRNRQIPCKVRLKFSYNMHIFSWLIITYQIRQLEASRASSEQALSDFSLKLQHAVARAVGIRWRGLCWAAKLGKRAGQAEETVKVGGGGGGMIIGARKQSVMYSVLLPYSFLYWQYRSFRTN